MAASLANAADITENDYLAEMPVVLSASRLSQPLSDAPSSMTVIDREMIRASGYRNIADLFRLVPGFYVSDYNGHQPIVSYHGMSDQYSRRMQVLVDGRSVYMPPTGGVDWSVLPITVDDIEKIEVVRGPSAAAYGANSFLGVISITTKNPQTERGAAYSITRGDYGIGDGFFRYAGNEGRLNYRFATGYRSDSGFSLVNDTQRTGLVNLNGSYEIDPMDSLEFRAGYARSIQGLGNPGNTGLFVDPSDPPRNSTNSSDYEDLKWVRNLDGGDDLSLHFYHEFQRLYDTYSTLPGLFPGNAVYPINAGIAGERYHLEYQQSASLSSSFRQVWGGSLRIDSSVAPLYMTGRMVEPSQLLFWHGEWRPAKKVTFNAGGMLEHNSFTGSDFSPQIAVNYHFDAQNTLRASYSSAVRTPVMFEQKANMVYVLGPYVVPRFISPGNLLPERIRTGDFGYVGDFFASKLVVDARIYRDHYDNLIAVLPLTFPRTLGNYGTADGRGGEVQLNWNPEEDSRLSAGVAHEVITGNYPETYNQSMPKNSVNLIAMHRFPGRFETSCVYTRQGGVNALGPAQYIGGYSRVDLRIAKGMSLADQSAEIALVIQNLMNTPYAEFRTLNVFDRHVFVTFSVGM